MCTCCADTTMNSESHYARISHTHVLVHAVVTVLQLYWQVANESGLRVRDHSNVPGADTVARGVRGETVSEVQ